MKKLINIADQQFYYSTIDQLIERCSRKERCAIIIDENQFDELISKGGDIVGPCVDQLIIISENVDAAVSQLEGFSLLLIAVGSFEEAVKVAMLGVDLSKEVVCITKEDEHTISEMIGKIVP